MSESKEVIPEAAVEAAAKAMYEKGMWSPPFRDARSHAREGYLTQARHALEAAVPHLMAAAFNEAAGELAERMNDPRDYATKGYWTGPAHQFLVNKAQAASRG